MHSLYCCISRWGQLANHREDIHECDLSKVTDPRESSTILLPVPVDAIMRALHEAICPRMAYDGED
jgi:hypothetical protein